MRPAQSLMIPVGHILMSSVRNEQNKAKPMFIFRGQRILATISYFDSLTYSLTE